MSPQERFENTCESLQAQGYTARDRTLSGAGGSAMLATVLPVSALFVALYAILARSVASVWQGWVMLAAGIVCSVPVHELLHALGWAAVNRSLRCVRLGFDRRTCTPYCACSAPMQRGKYLVGVLFPWLLLGIVPAALSVALKNICLLIFALVNVVFAGADTAVALRATTCRANLLLDHYERAGFYAFSK